MKRQCPNCESLDVKVNEKGQLVCFSCFNLFSTDSLKEINAKDFPPFPQELERKQSKRKNSHSDSSPAAYKRVIS